MSTDLRLRFFLVNDGGASPTYKVTLSYEPKNPPPGWLWPDKLPEFTGTGATLQSATQQAIAAFKAAKPTP